MCAGRGRKYRSPLYYPDTLVNLDTCLGKNIKIKALKKFVKTRWFSNGSLFSSSISREKFHFNSGSRFNFKKMKITVISIVSQSFD